MIGGRSGGAVEAGSGMLCARDGTRASFAGSVYGLNRCLGGAGSADAANLRVRAGWTACRPERGEDGVLCWALLALFVFH